MIKLFLSVAFGLGFIFSPLANAVARPSVPLEKWEKELKKEPCSEGETMICDDKASVELSKATMEKPSKGGRGHGISQNCFFRDHAVMLKVLVDNGYTYDKQSNSWKQQAPPSSKF